MCLPEKNPVERSSPQIEGVKGSNLSGAIVHYLLPGPFNALQVLRWIDEQMGRRFERVPELGWDTNAPLPIHGHLKSPNQQHNPGISWALMGLNGKSWEIV